MIAASERLDDQRFQTSFLVPDMHCAGCIGTIERGLLSMPQVESVRANLTDETGCCPVGQKVQNTEPKSSISSTVSDLMPSLDDLKQTLVDQDAAKGRRLLSSMAVSGFAAANIMLLSISVWSGAEPQNCATFSSHFRDHCSPCRGLCRAAVFPVSVFCTLCTTPEHGRPNFTCGGARALDEPF